MSGVEHSVTHTQPRRFRRLLRGRGLVEKCWDAVTSESQFWRPYPKRTARGNRRGWRCRQLLCSLQLVEERAVGDPTVRGFDDDLPWLIHGYNYYCYCYYYHYY